MNHINKHQSTLDALHECMVACNFCFDSCLKEENSQEMANCIRLDRECADICAYLAQAIARDSAYVKDIATICITICKDCGNECKQHKHVHCQNCAEACLNCVKECQKILV